MKPTFQIQRPSRHIESQRPQGQHLSKSPAIDWSYQSTAELRGGAIAPEMNGLARFRGLHALTQGVFEAETKWEDRIEGLGLIVVTALAAWPIALAIQMAINTVG